jgi:arylsulfatase A-like enzyme
MLKSYLSYFPNRGDLKRSFNAGQQQDTYSTYPYTPIAVDSRFGKPTNTSMTGFNSFDSDQTSQAGNYSLNQKYSSSFLSHDNALRALNRLAAQKQPFILTVSYHHPHPPDMAPFEYRAYYWDKRDQLFTTPNVHVPSDDSTSYYNVKEQKSLFDAGYCDEDNVKEWTAVYYAMIEQIDTLIGIMLDRLDKLGLTNKTLVIFTSDHGEMLGAHCQRGKNTKRQPGCP